MILLLLLKALKKELCHRCFPVNFSKFLRTHFFTEHLRWLLLYFSATVHTGSDVLQFLKKVIVKFYQKSFFHVLLHLVLPRFLKKVGKTVPKITYF